MSETFASARSSRWLVLALTMLALSLRWWQLDTIPPGWRDDELINSLVISQKVLDGEWAVYYPDASGHEALYHVLNAIMLGLFGPSVPGIRWLSVVLGTLAVPMTYLLGRRWFDPLTGLLAAAALALSFWSLMYSRIGLRHVLLPLLTLFSFHFFWRGLKAPVSDPQPSAGYRHFTLASLFTGLGFYTYFAARGIPLILLAFCGYLWLFQRPLLRSKWRGLVSMFGLMALFAMPLLLVLGQQPESEARVAELAVPLIEARRGDFAPLWQHIRITLSMFHQDGDDEWLYNIPHRPVFGPVGAAFFWAGVLVALIHALQPAWTRVVDRLRRQARPNGSRASTMSLPCAFLVLWWLAGISPGFVSVPPASLGHTILAQPAVFLLMALPLGQIGWLFGIENRSRKAIWLALIGLALVTTIGWRDLPAYFREWPQRGMVRFLYRADIHDVAQYLDHRPDLVDFGITSLLAGPWDQLAFQIHLTESRAANVRPRWYNPQRVALIQPPLSFTNYPDVPSPYAGLYSTISAIPGIGGYRLNKIEYPEIEGKPVCFQNGLCWLSARYDPHAQLLELVWLAQRSLDLPSMPLVSNPPPPGVYAGPRLQVFAQLHDTAGTYLVGDDGLWIDPFAVQASDIFLQQHRFALSPGQEPAAAVFGLYDPKSGDRILTEDGRDHLRLEIGD
jgi:4-amino-4-deoxy-L-arabinose transferase-like glycosyltransferase